MTTANNLSQLLKTSRLSLQKQTRELSQESGVAMSAISEVENGISQPTVITLVKLAHALDLNPSDVSAALGVAFDSTASHYEAENTDQSFSDAGSLLRRMRKGAGLTLLDTALKAGVSHSTISRMERGEIGLIHLNVIAKIDQVLNANGLIFHAFWRAGEFHSGVTHNEQS